MHDQNLHAWQHDHSFGQDKKKPGEARTVVVIVLTAVTMVVEIAAGIAFGSMALLADGLHMASHAVALGISAFAYVYARRHAHDGRYSFGTGKVNALGGFTGAVLLGVFAAMMGWESVLRFIQPVDIAFNQAIVVAVLGLIVNGLSVFILGHSHEHDEHEDDSSHDHADGGAMEHADHDHHHHDHNLRAAYLHVLADALTSVLAIFALLAGKFYDLIWMDPLMGIIGGALVAKWSLGLLRTTGAVLLDRQASQHLQDSIQESIENNGTDRVSDLHVWSIGPGIYAVELAVVTHDPKPPNHYKRLLAAVKGLVHANVEVHCHEDESELDDAESRKTVSDLP
ncbi:MAG: CDF family Co(II)/Ni(II) efflux transporter DmeF [Planctomycetes bacterium]|nr:CDF family Co(II)/Ni(II) efflux transporter DmeF [Planctomycetota bacterium]MBL7037259.1 CDF family Co(II)/Ni(II) efflux transporter DmeF [Pirellulaceae bacterium]